MFPWKYFFCMKGERRKEIKRELFTFRGGFRTCAFSWGLGTTLGSCPKVPLPYENTLVHEPPLQPNLWYWKFAEFFNREKKDKILELKPEEEHFSRNFPIFLTKNHINCCAKINDCWEVMTHVFYSILWCSETSDYQTRRFGYRSNIKVQFFWEPTHILATSRTWAMIFYFFQKSCKLGSFFSLKSFVCVQIIFFRW